MKATVMSSESPSQSSNSSVETSANPSSSIAMKRNRPKTAKVKETKFRKTGFEEDKENENAPPAKKPAPVIPSDFDFLLDAIPVKSDLNCGSKSVRKKSIFDETCSSNIFNEQCTLTEFVAPVTYPSQILNEKKKRKVHFADESGKTMVEVKSYERYIYLFKNENSTTLDGTAAYEHKNEGIALKNAFKCVDESENSNLCPSEKSQENVGKTSDAYTKSSSPNGHVCNTRNTDFTFNSNFLIRADFSIFDANPPKSSSPLKNAKRSHKKSHKKKKSSHSSPSKSSHHSSSKKHRKKSSRSSKKRENHHGSHRSRHHHHRSPSPDYRYFSSPDSRRSPSPDKYRGRSRHRSPALYEKKKDENYRRSRYSPVRNFSRSLADF